MCTAWAWSHCAVELVVHSGSAPGERCGCCSNVRPTEGFAQRQSQLLMQCHQDMQCMTTIKQLLGIVAMQCGWAVWMGGKSSEPWTNAGSCPKTKKNFKGRPSSARGTQTATATKVADFRKYPLSKSPQTRVLKKKIATKIGALFRGLFLL